MKKLTPQQNLIYLIGLISAALLMTVVLVVWPTTKKISELKRGITQVEREMEERYLNSQKLKRTMRELEEVRAQTQKFKQATIKKGDELRVITDLENLAYKHNIEQIINVNLRDKAGGDAATAKTASPEFYQFSFLNNGSFANHVKYLGELETLHYYVIVKDIKLEKRQGDQNSAPILTLIFNGVVYVDTNPQKQE